MTYSFIFRVQIPATSSFSLTSQNVRNIIYYEISRPQDFPVTFKPLSPLKLQSYYRLKFGLNTKFINVRFSQLDYDNLIAFCDLFGWSFSHLPTLIGYLVCCYLTNHLVITTFTED